MNKPTSAATYPSSDNDLLQDDQGSKRSGRRFRLLLDGGSLALFSLFLVQLLPLLVGSTPLRSEWQSDFVSLLVDKGVLAFLGFVLLHLAVFIQPRHDRLRRRLRIVRRLAVLPVIGYLLLVPLQLASSYGELTAARAQKVKYLETSSRLSEIRETIQQAKSSQDLSVRLQSLLEPEFTSEQWKMSLPQLQQSLLKSNDAKQAQVSRLIKENADDLDPFALVISRVGSALAWAFAFACGAVPWGHRSTLFERVRRR